MIRENRHKYSVSAMCKVLQLPKSTYYYEAKERTPEDDITPAIIEIFHANRRTYGTRRIKVELKKKGFTVSRRKIGRIMKEQGLVSKYTVAQFKPHKTTCNNSKYTNELNRQFDQEKELAVVVQRFDVCKGEPKVALYLYVNRSL